MNIRLVCGRFTSSYRSCLWSSISSVCTFWSGISTLATIWSLNGWLRKNIWHSLCFRDLVYNTLSRDHWVRESFQPQWLYLLNLPRTSWPQATPSWQSWQQSLAFFFGENNLTRVCSWSERHLTWCTRRFWDMLKIRTNSRPISLSLTWIQESQPARRLWCPTTLGEFICNTFCWRRHHTREILVWLQKILGSKRARPEPNLFNSRHHVQTTF